MVAARARDYYDAMAKERQRQSPGRGQSQKGVDKCPPLIDTGKARDQAGKAMGVSGKSVDRASAVLKRGSQELVKAVDAGKVSVARASQLTDYSPEMQRQAVECLAEKSKQGPRMLQMPTKPRQEDGAVEGA
ncbi:MAG: hypothetical protein JXQ73_02505 [Phycisphaerae bacterium]|nr:hypothetical protein [Phycisphaerae bacterium]